MPSLTARQRRLSASFRAMRGAAGLTQEDIVEQTGWSISKVYRLESGRFLRLNQADMLRWFDLCGVIDTSTRTAILTLAKNPAQRGAYAEFADVFPTDYPALEAEASKIREYHPSLIPGLLQTERYATAVITAAQPCAGPDEIQQRVNGRMARKQLLERPDAPELWVTIDEAVLHRAIGGQATMHEQLRTLLTVASQPGITVQVCRFTDGAHAAIDGPFILLEFPEQEEFDIAVLEQPSGAIYMDDREQAAQFRAAYDHLVASSASPAESLQMFTNAIERFGS